ncbi:flagellar assembly factor FliW [Geotalea uraniireducens]|uniref:Flagellar assembly factor FliW n=1 Tax=Geotalea uraniireducens TaxID=351604 RepID=A0ABN6VY08_9BACT|nr:flagellar assembly protein FliW [Geotalea uraniireducens]BDV44434.1 flagellar assembly factor FliW [Geotalea uraniireducens]
MKIATTRFGEIEVDDNKIIAMPDGMLGFADKRFVMLNPEKHAPFCWLQSVETPALSFVVIDARRAFSDYQVALTAEESERLALDRQGEIIVLLVVTLSQDPTKITANLQGPVVLNPARLIAKQVVLEGGKFSARQPLFASQQEPAPAANGG